MTEKQVTERYKLGKQVMESTNTGMEVYINRDTHNPRPAFINYPSDSASSSQSAFPLPPSSLFSFFLFLRLPSLLSLVRSSSHEVRLSVVHGQV